MKTIADIIHNKAGAVIKSMKGKNTVYYYESSITSIERYWFQSEYDPDDGAVYLENVEELFLDFRQ